jgi:hypothetical protein
MTDGFFSIFENPSSLENILVNRPCSKLKSSLILYFSMIGIRDYILMGSL